MEAARRLFVATVIAVGLVFLVWQRSETKPTELLVWGPPSIMPKDMKWGPPAMPHAHGRHEIHKGRLTFDLDMKNNKIAAPVTINLFAPGEGVGPVSATAALHKDAAQDNTKNSEQPTRPTVAARQSRNQNDRSQAKGSHQVNSISQQLNQEAIAAVQPSTKPVSSHQSQQRVKMSTKAVLQQLSALAKKQLSSLPKFDDSIASMRQLAERSRMLRAELDDARQSVVTESGMKRLHKLEEQLQDVHAEMRKLPHVLPDKIKEAEAKIAKARTDVEHLREKVYSAKKKLATDEALDNKSDVDLEAKVELLRAQQDAIADIMGKPVPKHEPLDALAGDLDVSKRIEDDKAKLDSLQSQLTDAKDTYTALNQDRDDLDSDLRENERAHEERSETARNVMLAEVPAAAAEVKKDDKSKEADQSQKQQGTQEAVPAKSSLRNSMFGESTVVKQAKPVDLRTFDAVNGEVETPDSVQKMAGVDDNEKDEPRLQWCEWGSQLVPCAPGYGGAYFEAGKRHKEGGIWPLDDEGPRKPSREYDEGDPRHVKAGGRSHSYFDDIFSYGKAGIFGARGDRPMLSKSSMLSGGHVNTQRAYANGEQDQQQQQQQQQHELQNYIARPMYDEAMLQRAQRGRYSRGMLMGEEMAHEREERAERVAEALREGAIRRERQQQLARLYALAHVTS